MNASNGIRRSHGYQIGLVAVLASVSLSACGSNGYGSSSSSTAPAAASPAAAGSTSKALATRALSLGTVLVDNHGRTVYFYAGDKGSTSACNGACATNWPPVPAPSSMKSISGISATLGSTTRSDGSHQLTVDGHPVYTFVGDSAPGQDNGQGKNLNGGLWTVVSPSGQAITGSGGRSGTSSSSSAYQHTSAY